MSLRGLWQQAAGLDAPMVGATAEQVLERTGWIRTLGGIDGYLALTARAPGLDAAQIDAELAARRVAILPAVRGCMYLVPARDFGLARAMAERHGWKRSLRDLAKAGVELDTLAACGDAVVDALGTEGLTPHALRKALPAGAIPPIRKVPGLSSLLPVVLRRLELDGRILRETEHGGLDSERYRWRRADQLTPPIEADTERLTRQTLAAAGSLSRDVFATWSALGKREAGKLLAEASVAERSGEFLHREDHPEPTPAARLLPFADNLVAYRGGPAPLVDPSDLDRPVRMWGPKSASTLGSATHVHTRLVSEGGAVTGYWEVDPSRGEVVALPFRSWSDPDGIEAECARVNALVAERGHAKSFSLDSDESLATRLDEIRRWTAR